VDGDGGERLVNGQDVAADVEDRLDERAPEVVVGDLPNRERQDAFRYLHNMRCIHCNVVVVVAAAVGRGDGGCGSTCGDQIRRQRERGRCRLREVPLLRLDV